MFANIKSNHGKRGINENPDIELSSAHLVNSAIIICALLAVAIEYVNRKSLVWRFGLN